MIARLATRADIPQLVELMHQFYAEASFPLDREWATRAFAALLTVPAYGAVWLVENQGVPIGHVVLSIRFAMEFGGLAGYIDDLFVLPEHRRKGAAGTALQALLSECRRRGCRAVYVEVGSDNQAAMALYRRYGLAPADDGRLTLRVVLEPAA